MSSYQVLARKYRPQRFSDVVGQDSIVTTLKNAVASGRIAHAYLFSGSRGTGKTTLARILAKTLNCHDRSDDNEPCSKCPSCKEIAAGTSLEVIEIDGASNRGIEDIRKVNDTVRYSARAGNYMIYIIDEVHMLTKEAFNALLKTLEEPPANVAFFFATTEPHKVLPTIMSRCQRYNLNRISTTDIMETLKNIAADLGVDVEDEALTTIATLDALSTLDQLISYAEGKITSDIVADLLGLMPRDVFFDLDKSGAAGDITAAFTIANDVFSHGKDIPYFFEELIKHYRTILLTIVAGNNDTNETLSENDRMSYRESAAIYNKEQCINILEDLADFYGNIKTMPSMQVALEIALMKIIRSHKMIPIEALVAKLADIENDVIVAAKETPQQRNTQSVRDTMTMFSAVELDGTATKKKTTSQ